jgi:hypothetical protein
MRTRLIFGLTLLVASGALLSGGLATGHGGGSSQSSSVRELDTGITASGLGYQVVRIMSGPHGDCIGVRLEGGGGAQTCGLPDNFALDANEVRPLGGAQLGDDNVVLLVAGDSVSDVSVTRADRSGDSAAAALVNMGGDARLVHAAIAAPAKTLPPGPSLDAAGLPATGAPVVRVVAYDSAGRPLAERIMGGPPPRLHEQRGGTAPVHPDGTAHDHTR